MTKSIIWSADEITTVINLYNEDKTDTEISSILKKPILCIKYQIKKLRKEGKIKLLYKKCYLCKANIPPNEPFNKCYECFQKHNSTPRGRLLIDLTSLKR
jgi:hypothetical protein